MGHRYGILCGYIDTVKSRRDQSEIRIRRVVGEGGRCQGCWVWQRRGQWCRAAGSSGRRSGARSRLRVFSVGFEQSGGQPVGVQCFASELPGVRKPAGAFLVRDQARISCGSLFAEATAARAQRLWPRVLDSSDRSPASARIREPPSPARTKSATRLRPSRPAQFVPRPAPSSGIGAALGTAHSRHASSTASASVRDTGPPGPPVRLDSSAPTSSTGSSPVNAPVDTLGLQQTEHPLALPERSRWPTQAQLAASDSSCAGTRHTACHPSLIPAAFKSLVFRCLIALTSGPA